MKSLMAMRQLANTRGNARQWTRTLIAAALVLALAAAAFNAAYVAAQTPNLVFAKTPTPTPTPTPTLTPAQSGETAPAATPTAADETQDGQAPQVAALWGAFTGGAVTATTDRHLLKTSVATYGEYDIHDVDGDYIHLSSFMRVLAAMRAQTAAALALAEAQPVPTATPAAAQ